MWPKHAHRSSLPTLPSHACAARVCVVRVSLHDSPVCSRLRNGPGSPSSSLDPCLVAYTTLPRVEGTAPAHAADTPTTVHCTAALRVHTRTFHASRYLSTTTRLPITTLTHYAYSILILAQTAVFDAGGGEGDSQRRHLVLAWPRCVTDRRFSQGPTGDDENSAHLHWK